jgi:hypothetical protein
VRVRACSRRRRPRPLSTKPVAGIGAPGLRSPTRPTILAHCNRCAAQMVSTIVVLFIVSCANLAPPPEVSPALIANAHYDHAEPQTLSLGRALFVSRCLECHTLPLVTKYSPHEWPHLVSRMSGRANLSASDQSAIVAYLRAASVTAR